MDGLYVEVDLPQTNLAADIRTLVKRGDIAGMSVRMNVKRSVWEDMTEGEEKYSMRTIMEADLLEISLTAFPAYVDTSAATRSYQQFMEQRNQQQQKPDTLWEKELRLYEMRVQQLS